MPPSKRKTLMDAIISQKCQNKENSSIISPTVTISSPPSTDPISAASSNARSCDDSSEPQQISEIAMYKRSDLPPPEGITQEQYHELLNHRGCQFCNKSRIRKIYWVFRIRCCGLCFKAKTTRGDSIASSVSSELICALPFHQEKGVKFYWSSMVDTYVKEYESIPVENRSDWLKQKYELVRLIMADVEIRAQADSEERKAMVEIRDQNSTLRKEAIAQYLKELLDEKTDDGSSKYLEKYIFECPSYQNAIQQRTPFTEKKWTLLKGKLLNEYQTVSARYKVENMDSISSDSEINSPDTSGIQLSQSIDHHKSNELVDYKNVILPETNDDQYLISQIPDQPIDKSCNANISKFSPSLTIDQKTEDICIEEQLLSACDNQNTDNMCIEAQQSLLDQYIEGDTQQPTSEIDTENTCTDILLDDDDSDVICQDIEAGSNEHFKWRMIPFSPETMSMIEATRESWKKQGTFEQGQPLIFETKDCVSSQIYGQTNMSAEQSFWLNDLYAPDHYNRIENLTPDQMMWSSENTSPIKYGISDEFPFTINQNNCIQQKQSNQQPTAPTTPVSWSIMNSITDASIQQPTSLSWNRQEVPSFDIFRSGNVTCPALWQKWIEEQLQQVHASEYFTSDRIQQVQLLSQQMYIIEKIRALLPRHTPLLLEQGITTLPTIASNVTFSSSSQYIRNPIHNNEYSQTRSVINLLKFLRWCPSFSDPPVQYNYPYQPWDERFVDEVLIPILSTEAVVFLRNPAHTIKGAVLRGLANTGLFRCKYCWFWARVPSFNYEYVRKHLMEFHKSEPLDELMEILVEYLPNNLDIPIDTKLWWELTKMSGKLD
ncbi:22457_t:CDS:2 [Dentiscutata erythropus]|uniref:22457_t:CDS:1 n=1 Tax=Dentiscutata erythropus TaxID=1348616 RepID=A0A9N9GVG6_9GLOM|nr:22457_t:CDS:2 [Dentiscutata erythropus]